jgi:MFS transporter, UMF1 family
METVTSGTPSQVATTRERVAWCLNDTGNSAFPLVMITAIYSIYFTDVVVGDSVRGVSLWGIMISCSMGVVAVSSPLMGALADRRRWRKRLLFFYTLLGVVATAACAFVGPGMVALGLLTIALANIAFEGSLVFYDSLLPGITTSERMGRWSGFGWSAGYVGGMACLILCLPLAKEHQFGAVFLLVAAWWFLFSSPLFFYVHERTPTNTSTVGVFSQFKTSLGRIRENPDLFRFFIAFFLYNDGIATTVAFAAIYAKDELGFDMASTIKLLICVQLSAAIGSFALGFLADKIGQVKTIIGTLFVWCGLILGAYFVETATPFWGIAIGVGVVLGGTQSCSRSFLASTVSQDRAGEYFGFKAVAGKFSAMIGPLLFAGITYLTGSQRPAILAVGLLFVAGLVLMFRVNEARAADVEKLNETLAS